MAVQLYCIRTDPIQPTSSNLPGRILEILARLGAGCLCRRGFGLVHCSRQGRASLEARHLLGGNLDLLASLRVTSGARRALGDAEGAKTDELHVIAASQGLGEHFQCGVEQYGGCSFAGIGLGGNGFDEFGFVHDASPFYGLDGGTTA